MNESWAIIIAGIIPSIISIFGFIITIRENKKLLFREIKKMQKDRSLLHNEDLPYKLNKILRDMIKKPCDEQTEEEFNNIINSIHSYGSDIVVSIVADMQNKLYNKEFEKNGIALIAYYAIIITQIKFEITGIKVSPILWAKINLNDYNKQEKKLKESMNEIIKEYNLELSL